MLTLLKASGWVVLALLASCPPTAASRAATALLPAPKVRPAASFTGYHRYRGTVGTQPVTMELTIEPANDEPTSSNCRGICRFDSCVSPPREVLSWHRLGPRQPLQLVEADTGRLGLRTGFWQARQPAGPVLVGTWTGAAGQQLPFELHEDYRDKQGRLAAVPYELLAGEDLLKVGSCIMAPGEWKARGGQPSAVFARQFLHFLGPDTLRGSIAALQCPPPADRRQQVWQGMRQAFMLDSVGQYRYSTQSEQPYEDSNSLIVHYQASGLLSWGNYGYYFHGGAHGGHSRALYVYDLIEGEFLELAGLLRPGAERAVGRLLLRHLETDEVLPQDFRVYHDEAGTVVELPEAGFAVVEKGLLFEYNDYELSGYIPPAPVVLTWAELLPLLRPDTPVARMLRARGIWH